MKKIMAKNYYDYKQRKFTAGLHTASNCFRKGLVIVWYVLLEPGAYLTLTSFPCASRRGEKTKLPKMQQHSLL